MRILAGNAQPNSGPRLTPAPARFHTVVGVPYTIALQYPAGKPVKSRYSGQMEMMYTLTTGEKAYFPMNVGEAIDSLTLAPGQPFTVCHNGGGSWDIDRAAPPPAPRPLPAQPTPNPPRPPLPPAASLHSSEPDGQPATKLEHALKTAILAASNAEKYGEQLGYAVRFDTDAIKAMAITVLINMEGGRK